MIFLSKIENFVAPFFVVLNYTTNSKILILEQMRKPFVAMAKKK
jgi:hypothetical protein